MREEKLGSLEVSEKPPLGLVPKRFHDAQRIKDIVNAMKRYSDAGRVIPEEWIDELRSFYH